MLAAIAKIDFKLLLAGVPLDLSTLSDKQIVILANLATHCIFNGPVGVNKDTSFPTGEKGSIVGLIGVKFTNSTWRATCQIIAQTLVADKTFEGAIKASSQVRQHKSLWPLY